MRTAPAGRNRRGGPCRGLSLIEILVGLALGLFLVGAAVSLFVAQLKDHRDRLAALRLTQELRSAMTLMEREVRRAGFWAAPEVSLWQSGASAPLSNPYAALHSASGGGSTLGYTYSRDTENHAADATERFGFRLNTGTRTLEMRLAGAALVPADSDTWQPVTDPSATRITRLAVTTQSTAIDLADRCALPCPPGSTTCPPQQAVRLVTIELAGQATTDATLTHALTSTVHVRADAMQGQCPT